jgi:uncharacterized protein YjaZ
MSSEIFVNYVKTVPDISSEEKDLLDNTIKKHALAAGSLLDIPYVTITVYPKSSWVIPETGEGGYTPSADWIQIYIDLKSEKYNLKDIIEKHIPGTIYHEMNHVARWKSVGYGTNFLEAIVSEGLASVFEKEHWKTFIAPWTQIDEKEIEAFLKIFRKRDKNKDNNYNHAEWFYGKGELPRWIGYKVGTHIIEKIRRNFPAISWKKLVCMKADEIVKMSGIKLDEQ